MIGLLSQPPGVAKVKGIVRLSPGMPTIKTTIREACKPTWGSQSFHFSGTQQGKNRT